MSSEIRRPSDEEILAARHELWRLGDLTWKLSPPQKRMYEFWTNVAGKTTVFNAGRRSGKTYLLTLLAFEQCIKKKKSVVKFLLPEKGQAQTVVMPLVDKILEDCPPDIRPEYKTQRSAFEFPNGSKIQLGGTDNGNHEKLRGDDAHLCLVDEAGFLKAPLKYIIQSILAPATMRTFGKIILSSSTPTDVGHEFVKYMESSKLRNAFFSITTKQALFEHVKEGDTRFTQEMYDYLKEEYPLGEKDEDFRRECLNELITDGTNSVIPEFNDEIEKEIVTEWHRPVFFDRYVSMDIGFKDLTVVLFAYYDFINGVTVVEDEIVINGPSMTTEALANAIKQKEQDLWTDRVTQEFFEPYIRVCDNNLILINDLQRLHGLSFVATQKDNKEAQVNNLRMEISNFRVYINPKCKTLIHHLKHATWNSQRTGFARSPDAGHYDACDALIYLIRNIQKSHNPFPRGYDLSLLGPSGNIFIKPGYKDPRESDYNKFKDIFIKKSAKTYKK